MKKPFFILTILVTFSNINAQGSKDIVPISDTTFVKVSDYTDQILFDIKYATTDNFLREKVYNCGECYLRYKTLKSLLVANKKIRTKGYRFKLFDCYRPLWVQKKMWLLVPNPTYVADPAKGSLHNRGGAIDLTLVDKNGNELDFGTPFDFFGEQASHAYAELPSKVIKNRTYLKKVMIKSGFTIFPSEWWHYNIAGGDKFQVANFSWPCN